MTSHSSSLSADPARMQALAWLGERRSRWPLQEPGPDDAALARIFELAACAPDHASLVPWRFKYVRGAHRHALLEKVLSHPDAQTDEVQQMRSKYTSKLTTAPVVVVLAVHLSEHPKTPHFEQFLSCGAAVMNMLNAAHLQGFPGFWSSTPGALGELLKKVMGFEEQDHMAGLLNFGTAAQPPMTLRRAEVATFVSAWEG